MNIKRYRITLINPDLLAALNVAEWYTDIAAFNMASAWRKFNVQKKAPVWHLGADDGTGRAEDYDISLVRA